MPDDSKPADHGEAASKFLSGRCSFQRMKVSESPKMFGQEHLNALDERKAGRQRIASADGIECGWSAGRHMLDTDFQLAKNIINDCLVFDFRIDSDLPPADRLKAYTEIELKALSANNPSGFASKKQKREAKESARERLEQEAKDGRFHKIKLIPCLWDLRRGELLFGSSSLTQIDRFTSLFNETFAEKPMYLSSGELSQLLPEHAHAKFIGERAQMIESPKPSPFIPDVSPESLSWQPDDASRDFLGNEFALWLWHYTEEKGDEIDIKDGEVCMMLARTLTLECPRAATGRDTIKHEMPSRLPEAKRAAKAGKLPRKLGITMVFQQETYEFNLHAETFAMASVKLPNVGEDVTEPRARQESRADQLRMLIETVDNLYRAFLAVRLSNKWEMNLATMQDWLAE